MILLLSSFFTTAQTLTLPFCFLLSIIALLTSFKVYSRLLLGLCFLLVISKSGCIALKLFSIHFEVVFMASGEHYNVNKNEVIHDNVNNNEG